MSCSRLVIMRLTYLLLLVSVAATAQQKTNTACNALYYEPFMTWAGGRNILVIGNDCKDCKVEGPDYCSLLIFDSEGDTIAGGEINGIPEFGDKRSYEVFNNPRYREKEKPVKYRISLLPYCDNIRINNKKK